MCKGVEMGPGRLRMSQACRSSSREGWGLVTVQCYWSLKFKARSKEWQEMRHKPGQVIGGLGRAED